MALKYIPNSEYSGLTLISILIYYYPIILYYYIKNDSNNYNR